MRLLHVCVCVSVCVCETLVTSVCSGFSSLQQRLGLGQLVLSVEKRQKMEKVPSICPRVRV